MAKLKHIKAFPEEHEKIMVNVGLLRQKFQDKATKAGITIHNKGKGRDVIPGQPEAMAQLMSGLTMDEYVDRLIQNLQGGTGTPAPSVELPSEKDMEEAQEACHVN